MLKNKFQKTFRLAILCVLLSACAEQNYRGVPEASWKELSPEQKQLIVDQAYEQETSDTTNNE